MLALGLSLSPSGCERGKTPTPPEAGAAPAKPESKGTYDASSAYRAHDAKLAPEQGPRKRPDPAQVTGRDAALAAVAADNPEGALAFLETHVQAEPADLDARLALSRAQVYVGKFDEAAATLADPKGAPNDPDVVVRRSVIAERTGKAAEAIQWLEAATAKHPDHLPVRGELLWMLGRTGKIDTPRAKALLEGLYDAYDAGRGTSAAELLAVAQAALSRGSTGGFQDGNSVLQDAEEAAPVKEGSWIGDRVLLVRGAVFLRKYAQNEAAETFGLILERDPWHPDALVGMARVHVAGLRFADASRYAEEALQVAPGHPDAHTVLAEIAIIEGRHEEASERITKHVLTANPSHRGGHAVLSSLAIYQNDRKAYERSRDAVLAVHPTDGDFFTHIADILGFLHLYPESDEVLREAVGLAPDDPYVLSALGLNQLRIGKEKAARASLAAAWKGDRFNERTRNVLDLYEDTIDKHYGEKTLGDLTVRLPDEDRDFVEGALVGSISRTRSELDAAYHIKPKNLRVEFYSDPQAFSVRTVGVPSLGALAVCFGPVITFVGPYTGAYNMDMVVRHELAHTYAIQLSAGRVPRWFTEGLSEWESELEDPAYARESAELLAQARAAGKLRRLSELELAFIRAESGLMMEVAYATAAYAMRYIGSTYGREKVVAMLQGYAKGRSTDALFSEHLGKNVAAVEKEFEQWFFAELDRKVSGWDPSGEGEPDARHETFERALRMADSGDIPGATHELEALVQKDGDGYTVRMMLAKLLVDSSKGSAAVRHLEKARKFHTEAIEPLVMLANLARDQGNVDEEKRRLTEALEIDGDSLEPAARLLMLGHVTGDKKAVALARRRVGAIAPLHPITLCDEALRLANDGKKADAKKFLDRGAGTLAAGVGPSDTFVVASLAAAALGDQSRAKQLAKSARADGKLPKIASDKLPK